MNKKNRDLFTASEKSNHFSEERVALVIGNSTYQDAPLRNPLNDATDIAAVLENLNFEVDLQLDADQPAMLEAIDGFGRKLYRGGVGLFYFAGHGMQARGRNYIIPLNAQIQKELQVKYAAIDVGMVLEEMAEARNRVNIVILDACRNNPYERRFRSGSKGLAPVDASRGTIIAYATAPGRVAADGDDRNSPYTGELLQQIQVAGLEIERVFRSVSKAVAEKTKEQQEPWIQHSLRGDFYFIPPAAQTSPTEAPPPQVEQPPKKAAPRASAKSAKKSPKSPPKAQQRPAKTKIASVTPQIILRSTPESNLHIEAVKEMLKTNGFYDSYENPDGKGIDHQYKLHSNGLVVFDATTGLMWQQAGSSKDMNFANSQTYIAQLNKNKFASYTDWRLPTLEEAMSLMTPLENEDGLHIDPAFDAQQAWIWTSDQPRTSRVWCVGFTLGYCNYGGFGIGFSFDVRAVRFGQSSQ